MSKKKLILSIFMLLIFASSAFSAIQIQLRRDSAADWTTADPILAEGEIGVETDTDDIKIGDGVTAWSGLDYFVAGATTLTGLSDVSTATQGAGRLLISDGTGFNSVGVSGCTLNASGVLTCPDTACDGQSCNVANTGTLDGYEASALLDNTDDQTCAEVSGCVTNAATTLTGLTDVSSATQGSGRLLVSDGVDFQSLAISGDATVSGAGVVNVGNVTGNFSVGTSDFFVNDTTGNVGIGTTAPSTKLQVNGTVTATAFSGPLTGAVTGNADTATTTLKVTSGTGPTCDDAGEICHDTTDNQLVVDDYVFSYKQQRGFTLKSPAAANDNVPIFFPTDGITITNVYCMTQGGTSAEVIISDGTNVLETITCDADGQADDGSIANGTFTALERMEFDIGTVTGTVDWVNTTITYTITRE